MMKSCEDFLGIQVFPRENTCIFYDISYIFVIIECKTNLVILYAYFFTSLYNEVSEIFNGKNSVFSFNPRCRK